MEVMPCGCEARPISKIDENDILVQCSAVT